MLFRLRMEQKFSADYPNVPCRDGKEDRMMDNIRTIFNFPNGWS